MAWNLLSKLRENGLCCHMNGRFVNTFIYANNITIVSPSGISLTICDTYANKHHLIVSPTKTKRMFCPTNNNIKQFSIISKTKNISYVKECCFLRLKI